jgi:hypothetical protein
MKDEISEGIGGTENRKFVAYDKRTGEILYTYSVDTQIYRDPSQIVEFIVDDVTNKNKERLDRKDIEFTFFDLPENSDLSRDIFVNTYTKKIELQKE